MLDIWNQRYAADQYIYGIQPNEYLKEKLEMLNPGNILLPADGEGRNGVFAALKGWQVDAFDYSYEAKNKALKLAEQNNVTVNYNVYGVEDFIPKNNFYDVIAVIYVHLPEDIRISFFDKLKQSVKKGGCIIMEVFNTEQLKNTSGGPKDISLLYTKNQLETYFTGITIKELQNTTVLLDEGPLHQGMASVVRLFAVK